MHTTQTRSQKAKATPKTTGRAVTVEATAKQGNSHARPDSVSPLSAQERHVLVARAAYFRAEKRGFAPGGELQDWIEAEAEVLRLIGGA